MSPPGSDKLRESWRRFRRSRPGRRFQERYYQRQRSRRSLLRRLLVIGSGVVIFLAGIFFLPAPGPGMLILFIGASLIAQESLLAARTLDWTEFRLRALAARSRRWWRSASPAAKVLLAVSALVIVVALVFGAYHAALAAGVRRFSAGWWSS